MRIATRSTVSRGYRRKIHHAIFAVGLLLCAAGDLIAEEEADLLAILESWIDAPAGSNEEKEAFESLRQALPSDEREAAKQLADVHTALLEKRLGAEVLASWDRYQQAPKGSEAESEALAEFAKKIEARGISQESATVLFALHDRLAAGAIPPQASGGAPEEAVSPGESEGSRHALDPVEIDVKLTSSRGELIAGDSLAVFGEIQNRGDAPVWIVSRFTNLLPTPELWGTLASGGSLTAFFPSTSRTVGDDVIRINPASAYTVLWQIDHLSNYTGGYGDVDGKEPTAPTRQISPFDRLLERIALAWSGYLFFLPGEYRVSAMFHVWPEPPRRNDSGEVVNLNDSISRAADLTIHVESSPWVLIFGACVGGLLCFTLQTLHGLGSGQLTWRMRTVGLILLGVMTAVLLTSVVTILLSRLASSQFIVTVAVRDFWGAIATGFVIQWLGYPLISKILPPDVAEHGEDEVDPEEEEEKPPVTPASKGHLAA